MLLFVRGFWRRLLNDLGLRRTSMQTFYLEAELERSLQLLAERERRPREELVFDLLSNGLAQRQATEFYQRHWELLTIREQQIAALVCLGYTYRQVASILMLSPETIKSHMHNVLSKFGMRRREELRRALDHWDFSAWDPRRK